MARNRVPYRFANEEPGWRYEDLIFDEEPEVEEEREYLDKFGDFDKMWQQSALRSGPLGAIVRHQDELYQLLWPLLDMPQDRRREAAREEPYRDPELAFLLLFESEKDLAQDGPWHCVKGAQTAEWIADELSPDLECVPAIRARARALQGAARHLLGHFRRGESLFHSALSALAECPDPAAWAYFFERLAQARLEQDRLPEAVAYLSRAVELYRDEGFWYRPHEQQCLRRLARLHLRCSDPGRAMAALAQVELERLSLAENAEVLLGLASCCAAAGLREPARLFLQESRALRRRMLRKDHRRPLEWWDARVVHRLGDLEEAVPRLDAVRRDLLGSLQWAEACSASVELLLAYAQAGTRGRKRTPAVFKQLARSWKARVRFVPPVEAERAALEDALRDAAGLLRRHSLPEAADCEALLESVLSAPTTRDWVSVADAELRGDGRRSRRPARGRTAKVFQEICENLNPGRDPNG